jgi:hypothetical protein
MGREPGSDRPEAAADQPLAAGIARAPARFAQLLDAPPAGVSVAWQHLWLDGADRSDAVELSWRAATPWRTVALALAGVLAWYAGGLLLLFRFLAHPVLGIVCLVLLVLPPAAVLPWLSWHLSGEIRLLFTPDRRLCLSLSVSVLAMYTAQVSSLDIRRTAVSAIGVSPQRGTWWRPWAREISVVEARDGVEVRLGRSRRSDWLAAALSAWSGAPVSEPGQGFSDREEGVR